MTQPVLFGPRTAQRLLDLLNEPEAAAEFAGGGARRGVVETFWVKVEDRTRVGDRYDGKWYRHDAEGGTFVEGDECWIVRADGGNLEANTYYLAKQSGIADDRAVYIASIADGVADKAAVWIRNQSGAPLSEFAIVGLAEPTTPPSDDLPEWKLQSSFDSAAPVAGAYFAIVQQPLEPGEVGRAWLCGVAKCLVNLIASGHGYADAENDNYTTLVSHAGAGPAALLSKGIPAATTLDGGIDDVTTTLTVADAAGWVDIALLGDGEFVVTIDTEDVLVTAVDGEEWTVTREHNSTTPASHADGATVTFKSGVVWCDVEIVQQRGESGSQKDIVGGVFSVDAPWDATTNITHTWTCPAAITRATIICIGLGAPAGADEGSGGGGGGAYAEATIDVEPGTVYDIDYVAGDDGYVQFDGGRVKAANGKQGAEPTGVGTETPLGGDGGDTADCVGDVLFAGGNGGAGWTNNTTIYNRGGGGGSAWKFGDGENGTSATADAGGIGGRGSATGFSPTWTIDDSNVALIGNSVLAGFPGGGGHGNSASGASPSLFRVSYGEQHVTSINGRSGSVLFTDVTGMPLEIGGLSVADPDAEDPTANHAIVLPFVMRGLHVFDVPTWSGEYVSIDRSGPVTFAFRDVNGDLNELYQLVKHNFKGKRDPIATDNAAEGYARGSVWVNTIGDSLWALKSFSGTDATWVPLTGIASINGATGPAITLAFGSTGSDLNIGVSGNTITLHVPTASATARGVVSTGSQTFAGDKTFSGTVSAANVETSGTPNHIRASDATGYAEITNAKIILNQPSNWAGGGTLPVLATILPFYGATFGTFFSTLLFQVGDGTNGGFFLFTPYHPTTSGAVFSTQGRYAINNGSGVITSFGQSGTDPAGTVFTGGICTTVGTGPISVSNGGTGATSLTAGGFVLGQGTGAVTTLALASHQIPIGNTGSNPTALTLDGDAEDFLTTGVLDGGTW